MITAARRAVTAQGPGFAVGLVLGLLALGPGLRRGFLLSYDMVFVPREPFTSAMFGLSGGAPRAVPSDFARCRGTVGRSQGRHPCRRRLGG